jgi:hypothetical protein
MAELEVGGAEDADALLESRSTLARLVGLSKRYGVVRYRGTPRHQSEHLLTMETDDPVEALRHLSESMQDAPLDYGYILVVREIK